MVQKVGSVDHGLMFGITSLSFEVSCIKKNFFNATQIWASSLHRKVGGLIQLYFLTVKALARRQTNMTKSKSFSATHLVDIDF